MISQLFRGLPKFVYVGDITSFNIFVERWKFPKSCSPGNGCMKIFNICLINKKSTKTACLSTPKVSLITIETPTASVSVAVMAGCRVVAITPIEVVTKVTGVLVRFIVLVF